MTPTEREAWLEQRRKGLGASDMPNLMGVGYGTAASVWREKQGLVDDRPGGQLRRGLFLEPEVARMYEETMGTPLAEGEMVWATEPGREWMFSTLDRRRATDGRPVELKTTAGFGPDWGPNGSDLIPEGYRVQVVHQMGVVGADFADLIALDVIAWEPRVYRVEMDRRLFDLIADVGGRFMEQFVRPAVPPPEGWERQFAPEVKSLVVRPDQRVELGEDVAVLLERRARLLSVRKEAEGRLAEIDAALAGVMGDAAVGEGCGWKVRRTAIGPTEVPATTRAGYVRTTVTRAKQ